MLADISAPNGGQKIFKFLKLQFLCDFFLIDGTDTGPVQLAIQSRPPLCNVFLEMLVFEPVPDLGAYARALQETKRGIEPVTARRAMFRSQDFHPLAVLQLGVEWHDTS